MGSSPVAAVSIKDFLVIQAKVECEFTLKRPHDMIRTYSEGVTFTKTKTRLYVPVITLSSQYNGKPLPHLKWGFNGTSSWNKYLSKSVLLAQNLNLNHLVGSGFQEVNRISVLAIENNTQRTSSKIY